MALVDELFSDESKWTQHSFAREKCGLPTLTDDPEAETYCLVGAIRKCYDFVRQKDIVDLIQKELNGPILSWNDNPKRKFEEVKALVKRLNV